MVKTQPQAPGSHLLLYDGVCGLCNRGVAFVLKRDGKAQFRFASLQSNTGQQLLRKYGRDAHDLDTFYVIANQDSGTPLLMDRARAGLFVLKTLGGAWRCAGILGVLPDSMLNFAYDCIARRRYRIFGKYDRCVLPRAEHRERFIDI
jgi:predicted DCC family thiol-disulfide oxidoreductase YuxK